MENLMNSVLEEGTIYEIISSARDRLSEMNSSPDGECSICLCPFDSLKDLYKVSLKIFLEKYFWLPIRSNGRKFSVFLPKKPVPYRHTPV